MTHESEIDGPLWGVLSQADQIEAFFGMLLQCSKENGDGDAKMYVEMRRVILADERLRTHAPRIVRVNPTLRQFWRYVQSLGGYGRREEALTREFEALRALPVEETTNLGTQALAEEIPMTRQGKLFVSHSSKDQLIVTDFVDDVLERGLGVPSNQIFYSSSAHREQRPPVGASFIESIRLAIRDSATVVAWITKDYFCSPMCMCELGAAWALLPDALVPILDGVDYGDVKAILQPLQLLNMSSSTAMRDLDHLHELLRDQMDLRPSITRWQQARDAFFAKHL